jgi:hypothetical protein
MNGTEVVDSVTVQQTSSPSVTCSGSEYKAEYFNNRALQGTPVVRCEPWPLNLKWGAGSPAAGIPSEGFSSRWTGRAQINAGTYKFTAFGDDGIRVWLDGVLIINEWRDQAAYFSVTRTVAGGMHDIRVEHYENLGGAGVEFRWEPAAPVPAAVTRTISVPGSIRWVDTGIDVTMGQTIRIHASGLIKIAGSDPGKSPAGAGTAPCTIPGVTTSIAPCWSLVGRVGAGSAFHVGQLYTGSRGTGRLYLGINDDVMGDNSGSWTATITVQ